MNVQTYVYVVVGATAVATGVGLERGVIRLVARHVRDAPMRRDAPILVCGYKVLVLGAGHTCLLASQIQVGSRSEQGFACLGQRCRVCAHLLAKGLSGSPLPLRGQTGRLQLALVVNAVVVVLEPS